MARLLARRARIPLTRTLTEDRMIATRREVRVLVLGASLGSKSLNNRLATLAARVAGEKGGIIDHAMMEDFDAPYYDPDVEAESGPPAGPRAFCDRLKRADAL